MLATIAALGRHRDAGLDPNDTLGLGEPRDLGAVTGGIYVVVDDVEAHYDRAKAAGAEMVQELVDDGYGRRFSAHDLDGHLWIFGTYRPSTEIR